MSLASVLSSRATQSNSRSATPRSSGAGAAAEDPEAWPYLDEGVLRASRSRKVCMTCHSSAITLA